MIEVVCKSGREKVKIEEVLIMLIEGGASLTRAEDEYWRVYSMASRATRWEHEVANLQSLMTIAAVTVEGKETFIIGFALNCCLLDFVLRVNNMSRPLSYTTYLLYRSTKLRVVLLDKQNCDLEDTVF